jgi:hypothetical protein
MKLGAELRMSAPRTGGGCEARGGVGRGADKLIWRGQAFPPVNFVDIPPFGGNFL